jgi:hypothetical protein
MWGTFPIRDTIIQVADGSPAADAGFMVGDYITRSDGIAMENTRALTERGRPAIGHVRTMELERDAETVTLQMQFSGLPTVQKLTTHFASVIGACFLVLGLWAYFTAPGMTTRLLAVLGVMFAPAFLAVPYFSSAAIRTATGSLVTLLVVTGFAVMMHFLLAFPKPKAFLSRPNAKAFMYGPAAVVALLFLWVNIFQPASTSGINVFFRTLAGLFLAGYFAVSLGAMIHSYVKASPAERTANGLNLMLVGCVVALGPMIITALLNVIVPTLVLPGSQYYFLTFVLVPITFALAATRGGGGTVAERVVL